MWSTILPELMSLTVFILTILTLQAGRSPGYLPNYTILSLNTTGLKTSYQANTAHALPIHDVYNLYMTTHCQGYYQTANEQPLTNVTCSHPSSYSKFLPGTLISDDLSASHSNATLASLSLPSQMQDNFNQSYNLQLHVAFVFYILSLVCTGIVILWGLVSFWMGALGAFAVLFTSSGSTCLLIASAILTAVQSQAAGMINDNGNAIGVSASFGGGILALTWSAFGLSCASSVVWSLAGIASAIFRDL